MRKKEYLGCIINLLKALYENNNSNLSEIKFCDVYKKSIFDGMFNCKYILNQMLRLYVLPKENYHVSEEARNLWDELTYEDIFTHRYDETFKANKIREKVTKETCKGNSKKVSNIEISPDESIKFNALFITEHIVPLSDIIQRLFELRPDFDQGEVEKILNKIHVALLRKTENSELGNKRDIDFSSKVDWWKQVVDKDYKKAGITIFPL